MKWRVEESNVGKSKTVDIDLGFIRYRSGYTDDGEYIVNWEIDWEGVLVGVFILWVIYEIAL